MGLVDGVAVPWCCRVLACAACLNELLSCSPPALWLARSDAGDSAGRGSEGDCARHRVCPPHRGHSLVVMFMVLGTHVTGAVGVRAAVHQRRRAWLLCC